MKMFLVSILGLLAVASCGLELENGGLICAPQGLCPKGYHCGCDVHCWADGTEPKAISCVDGGTPNSECWGTFLECSSDMADVTADITTCGAKVYNLDQRQRFEDLVRCVWSASATATPPVCTSSFDKQKCWLYRFEEASTGGSCELRGKNCRNE